MWRRSYNEKGNELESEGWNLTPSFAIKLFVFKNQGSQVSKLDYGNEMVNVMKYVTKL